MSLFNAEVHQFKTVNSRLNLFMVRVLLLSENIKYVSTTYTPTYKTFYCKRNLVSVLGHLTRYEVQYSTTSTIFHLPSYECSVFKVISNFELRMVKSESCGRISEYGTPHRGNSFLGSIFRNQAISFVRDLMRQTRIVSLGCLFSQGARGYIV